MGEDDLVEAAAFLFAAEANVAQALLESEGVPSYLENQHMMTWGPVVFGYRLLVPASSLARAQELLAAKVSDEELAAEAEDNDGLAER
jgi:hypothetical protein